MRLVEGWMTDNPFRPGADFGGVHHQVNHHLLNLYLVRIDRRQRVREIHLDIYSTGIGNTNLPPFLLMWCLA